MKLVRRIILSDYIRRSLALLICLALILGQAPLTALAVETFSGGDGSEGSPYIISSVEDLNTLAQEVNGGEDYQGKFFVLTQNIDFSGEALVGESNFTPIGAMYNPFRGIFDGDGKTISGIVIDKPGGIYQGLFGHLGNDGIVKNVTLNNLSLYGQSYIGGIAGWNYGSIINCSVSGTVEGNDNIGGLVGANGDSGVVENSINNAAITGYRIVGGITGENHGTVEHSINHAAVTGNHTVGGITGVNYSIVENNSNHGDVTATGYNFVGGIVGYNEDGLVRSTANYGDVNGNHEVGGIIGYNQGGIVSHNTNEGNVSGVGNNVGGIVGYNLLTSLVEESTNYGDVEGKDRVGGVVGLNQANGHVEDGINYGTVTGESAVGGVVGVNDASAVRYSINFGQVIGSGVEIGGIAGANYMDAVIELSFNSGDIEGPGDYKGGIVGANDSTVIDSTNTGSIKGPGDYLGGVTGYNSGGNIQNSFSIDTHPDEDYPEGIRATYEAFPADTLLVVAIGYDNIAEGDRSDDELSYQWYFNSSNSYAGATLIDGANANTYTIPTNLVVGNYYYFCLVTITSESTDGTAEAFSRFVQVVVEPVEGEEGSDQTGGDEGTLPVTGTSYALYYFLLALLLIGAGIFFIQKKKFS